MEQDGTYSYVPGVPPKKKRGNPKNLKSAAVIVLVVILALITVFTSYYTVDDKQQAVVTTFGRGTDITDAGVHSGKFRIALPGHEYMAVRLTRV